MIIIVRKFTAGYKISRLQEKINHLMYMDDIKLFAQKGKRTRNSDTPSQNIHSGQRNRIWHRKCAKRQMTPNGRNGTAKSRQD